MAIIAVECANCGAKLKIKAGLARTPVEVKCPKCSKMIPVSKDAPVPPTSSPAAVSVPPLAPVAPPPDPVTVSKPAPAPATPPPSVPKPAPAPVTLTPPPLPPPPPEPAPAPVAPVPPAETAPAAPRKAAAPIVLSHLGEQHGPLSVSVQCAACRWTTKVREELIGKKIRCKQCGAIVPVVADGTAVAPAAASASTQPPAPEVPVVPPAPAPSTPPVVPTPVPVTPAAVVETLKPPVPMAVTPPPAVPSAVSPAAPKPAAVTSSAMDALVAEVSQLKTRLIQTEGHKTEIERRAAMAEKAFQEAAGQRAVDEINTRRRITELEAQVAELKAQANALRALLAECKTDTQSELHAATQRVAALQQRLSRLG